FLRFLGRAAGVDVGLGAPELRAVAGDAMIPHVFDALRGRGLLPPEIDARRLGAVMAAFKAAATSAYRPGAKWDGPTLCLRARDAHPDDGEPTPAQRAVLERPARGWEEHTSRPIAVLTVAGDHVSMLSDPHVAAVAARLSDLWN